MIWVITNKVVLRLVSDVDVDCRPCGCAMFFFFEKKAVQCKFEK